MRFFSPQTFFFLLLCMTYFSVWKLNYQLSLFFNEATLKIMTYKSHKVLKIRKIKIKFYTSIFSDDGVGGTGLEPLL